MSREALLTGEAGGVAEEGFEELEVGEVGGDAGDGFDAGGERRKEGVVGAAFPCSIVHRLVFCGNVSVCVSRVICMRHANDFCSICK